MDMNFKGELIVKIMGGEEQIWEMPNCEILNTSFNPGRGEVEVTFFPKTAQVTFEITEIDWSNYQSKVVYKETKRPNGNKCTFKIPAEYKQKAGQITVFCKGFKSVSDNVTLA